MFSRYLPAPSPRRGIGMRTLRGVDSVLDPGKGEIPSMRYRLTQMTYALSDGKAMDRVLSRTKRDSRNRRQSGPCV